MKAANLIKKGWCQGVEAKSKNGRKMVGYDPRATKFSIIGAIKAAYQPKTQAMHSMLEKAHKTLTKSKGSAKYSKVINDLAEFNDAPTTKHKDVINLLEKARV